MIQADLPKISIVMPTLNQAAFIEQAILSVLDQGYPKLEFIVIDGLSSDGTLNILKKYAGRLHWVSEKDNGQAQAINKGLRMSTGEVVTYLNSDDILEPGALSKIAQVFQNDLQTLWVIGRCRNINAEGYEIRGGITFYKNLLLRLRSYPLLLIANFISQPGTCWRRQIMEQIGFFDESLIYAMDYDFFLRLWRKHPPVYLPEYLACFRIQKNSKTASVGISPKYLIEERNMIRKHTSSFAWLTLHNLHRAIINFVYINIA